MSDFLDRISKLSPKRLALLAMDLQSKVEALERGKREPVAVVGMSCRLPGGVSDSEAYWRLLTEGVDAISEVPADRFALDAFYDPDPDAPGKMSTRNGGFLGKVDGFDPLFFGISPREALSMDPQQRLLLEVAWEALENAGESPELLQGSRTGVFVGICSNDYYGELLRSGDPAVYDPYLATGSSHSIASGRISYILGLHGPSLSIDTACSSSLVAVHLACQSLRSGESRMALAGGVNLILAPDISITLSKAHMMAPDGRCKTFDSAADGFVRGEGCGVVVLKKLSDAMSDGDRILAVIRGSAVNQDGRSSGITAPNGPAQEDVIRQALTDAGLRPADMQYVETHGTGTPLGDPIEVQALGAVLREGRTRPVAIGSVKTNFGHLEAAAGVAGLIKLVLALQHEEIPPQLHFRTPSPHIPWSELPVEVVTERRPWPANAGPRIGGVSSFGFSGTNAHLVVEGAPPAEVRPSEFERPIHVLALSARTEAALSETARLYEEHFAARPEVLLSDIAYTAGTGRSHFARRLAITAGSTAEAREKLARWREEGKAAGVFAGQARGSADVAFLFTGQGAQYVGMGRGLFATQPTFRRALTRCDEILRPLLERPLLSVLYPEANLPAGSPIDETAYTQPALFAVEYALAEVWRSWGIEPSVLMGHSVGEYVAACLAGVFSLEDGLRLIAARGRLMGALPSNGEMAAVLADEERVRAATASRGTRVGIAAVNGPDNVVVSGEREAVAEVLRELESQGIKAKRLTVSHAFHSPLMEPMLAEFETVARSISFSAPAIGLVGNLTGSFVSGEVTRPEYWVRHVRDAVRFADGMHTLHAKGYRIFLETGPAPTLLGMGRRCLPGEDSLWLPSLRPGRDDWSVLLDSLGALYARGAVVDWKGFDQGYGRSKVALPTYPFERERYWHAAVGQPRLGARASSGAGAVAGYGLPGHRSDAWLYQTQWRPRALQDEPAGGVPEAPYDATGRWIILADRGGVGRALALGLTTRGGTCVLAGHEPGDSPVVVDPSRPEDFVRLVHEAGDDLRGVVHLWALDAPTGEAATTEDVTHGQVLACRSALHLVQALAPAARSRLSGLWLVTRGAQGGEGLDPSPLAVTQATPWGLGKVIALEYPELRCVRVDLAPGKSPDETASLLAEVTAGGGEDQVALRPSGRHVARLVRGAAPPLGADTVFRADATYLVTGGLAGLGLLVARFLVERGARNLVLMARRSPSETARQAIEELTRAGARVVAAQGDVSRESDLAEALAPAGRSLPPLRGVFHSAGVLDDGVLFQQDWARFARVLAPKVEGGWNLHRATRELPLDFFVLFSSGASLLGSPGQANYAAANAFLDALAHHRRALGLPALSINWGVWGEVGAAADRGLGGRLARQGMVEMPPRDALGALARVLSAQTAQIGILAIDWDLLGTHLPSGVPFYAEMLNAARAGGTKSNAAREVELRAVLAGAPPSKRWGILHDHVRGEVVRVLGLDPGKPVESDRPLQELGLDSLIAVELRNGLGALVGVTLPATLLYDYPTIEKLIDHLGREVLRLDLTAREEPAPVQVAPTADAAEKHLEALSDDEMAALLTERLDLLESEGKGPR